MGELSCYMFWHASKAKCTSIMDTSPLRCDMQMNLSYFKDGQHDTHRTQWFPLQWLLFRGGHLLWPCDPFHKAAKLPRSILIRFGCIGVFPSTGHAAWLAEGEQLKCRTNLTAMREINKYLSHCIKMHVLSLGLYLVIPVSSCSVWPHPLM